LECYLDLKLFLNRFQKEREEELNTNEVEDQKYNNFRWITVREQKFLQELRRSKYYAVYNLVQ